MVVSEIDKKLVFDFPSRRQDTPLIEGGLRQYTGPKLTSHLEMRMPEQACRASGSKTLASLGRKLLQLLRRRGAHGRP